MSTIEIVRDQENKMLSRRELALNFRGGSGMVTRKSATEAIAAKVNVTADKVKLISLQGKYGDRDLSAIAYVYSNPELIKKQLPKYMMLRELSKEDRKKAKDAAKAEKAKAAAPAEKK